MQHPNKHGFTENLYYGEPEKGWIRTVGGRYLNILNPDQEQIDIKDIAHALSQTPRFSGHLKEFFSVAQHSMDVLDYCRESLSAPAYFGEHDRILRAALLHDAAEAYLTDLPAPIKAAIPGYKAIEDNLLRVIAAKFEFDFPLPAIVKTADKAQLEMEWNEFMIGGGGYGCNMPMTAKDFLAAWGEIKPWVILDQSL
jgi:5'-deoxynucleotidase YfbR-like HD superfamily hydrolase